MSLVDEIKKALAALGADVKVLRQRVIYVEDYGAKDDGSDASTAIQAAVNACPAYGRVALGGKTYSVGTPIVLDRPVTLSGGKLVSLGGSTNGTSVVSIGKYYDTRQRYDLTVEDVEIDGRRDLHTGISGDEDGARHGIRVIGPVRGITLRRVNVHHCATDGVSVFHGLGMSSALSTSSSIMQSIRIEDSTFTKNRRHGGSSSSTNGLVVVNSRFTGNGLDEGSSEGALGARRNSNIYGNGWDAEEYAETTTLGSHTFIDCLLTGNASRGFLAHQPSANDSASSTWVQRGPFIFERCKIDNGASASQEAVSLVTLNAGVPRHYGRLSVTDCEIKGQVYAQSVADVRVQGGSISTTSATAVVLARVDRAGVMTNLQGKSIYTDTVLSLVVEPQSAPSIFVPASAIQDVSPAAPTLTTTIQAKHTLRTFPDSAAVIGLAQTFIEPGWSKVQVDLLWTTGDAVVGNVAWRLDQQQVAAGTTLADPPNGVATYAAAPGTAWKIVRSSLGSYIVTGGSLMELELLRLGNVGGDTYSGTAHVLGLIITRTA